MVNFLLPGLYYNVFFLTLHYRSVEKVKGGHISHNEECKIHRGNIFFVSSQQIASYLIY